MFIRQDDGSKRIIFDNLDNIEESLEPGVYSLKVQEVNGFFGKQESMYLYKVNTFINKNFVKAGIYKRIDDLINIHLSDAMAEAKRILKLRNKIGMMFNGAPGTGKTFTAGLIGQRIVDKKEGICIVTTDASGERARKIIQHLRTFTDKPIVWVFDEFEKSVECGDSALLSLLDGVDSPENIIFIATVNDTSKLPNFIMQRPGRFENIVEFKIEDPIILKNIVESILPKEYRDPKLLEDINKSILASSNKTIDKIVLIMRDHLSKFIYLKSKNKTEKGT
jgi:SpoVK/Ycf46/Vps4 family AAA+-type ATPase